jgi:hypothetical protein
MMLIVDGVGRVARNTSLPHQVAEAWSMESEPLWCAIALGRATAYDIQLLDDI